MNNQDNRGEALERLYEATKEANAIVAWWSGTPPDSWDFGGVGNVRGWGNLRDRIVEAILSEAQPTAPDRAALVERLRIGLWPDAIGGYVFDITVDDLPRIVDIILGYKNNSEKT